MRYNATFLTATIAAGSNVIYQWDFGDGFSTTGDPVTHTYSKRILEAVIHRDPEAAWEAMRAHLQQVRQDSKASAAPTGAD